MKSISVILYASDMGKGSKPAFQAAIHQAFLSNAQIIYLHVLESDAGTAEELINAYMPEAFNKVRLQNMYTELRKKIKKRLTDYHEEALIKQEMPNIPEPIIEVVQGKADRVILDTADRFNADLIVMGDRSSSSLARVFLGSTARKVIHHSNIPVLIIPLEAE